MAARQTPRDPGRSGGKVGTMPTKTGLPREESVIHGLTVAKMHGTDTRFTIPRSEAARLASGAAKRSWVACECDLCKAIHRWIKARQPAARGARR